MLTPSPGQPGHAHSMAGRARISRDTNLEVQLRALARVAHMSGGAPNDFSVKENNYKQGCYRIDALHSHDGILVVVSCICTGDHGSAKGIMASLSICHPTYS